jgi:hypothetical protein
MKNRFAVAAVLLGLGLGGASAADLGKRVVKPPVAPPSSACLEKSGLPADVFGISTGSDVSDVGAWALAADYLGTYKARGLSFAGNNLILQASTAFTPCLEVGPYLTGFYNRGSGRGITSTFVAGGAGLELKYKFLGRSVHGVGATIALNPFFAGGEDDVTFLRARSGNIGGGSLRLLLDAELAPKLFGALNLEYIAAYRSGGLITGSSSKYLRGSALNVRGALSYQVAEPLYLGVEGSAQYARAGNFLNRELGQAYFVGPTFFWQATKAIAISGSYQAQVYGKVRGVSGNQLDLTNFSQHQARLKFAYSF